MSNDKVEKTTDSIISSLREMHLKADKLINGLAKVFYLVEPIDYKTNSINFYQPSGGQLQFSVSGPSYKPAERFFKDKPKVRWPQKMGAVFVEGAPPIQGSNPPKLDWTNKKIVFAIGDKDIGQILWAFANKSDIRIVHAPDDNAKSNNKTLAIKRAKDWNGQPQWSLSLTEKKNGETNSVSMFIKGPDMMRLKNLLEQSLPYIIGAHRA